MHVVMPLILLLLLLAPPVALAGTTYHVRLDGDNTRCAGTGNAAVGTVPPCAWRTLAHAVSRLRAGDTLLIGPGRFAERLTLKSHGAPSRPMVLRGTRSKDGGYETILDGSTPVTTTWNAVEGGSYTTQLPYTPWAMTSKGLGIWRCGDHAMQSGKCQETLAIPPEHEWNIAVGKVKYWDGIEALFGVKSGVTHLRFRNKEHPRDMDVRAAPSGGVVTISTPGVTIEHVKIVGGQYAVRVTEGAHGATIQDCYLTHGQHRVLIEGNAQGTVVTRNVLTYDGIGFQQFPAGDWSSLNYDRIVNRHRYDENKFLVGDTETNDSSIELVHDSGTIITDNTIRDSVAGITFHGSTSNAIVAHNRIYQHSDNCVYINSGYSSVSFHHNVVYDCDHLMRFQSTEQDLQWEVYANSFWQPAGTGKHLFFNAPGRQPGNSTIGVYQNSHAGTGWAVDVGSDGQHVDLSFVSVGNLVMSVDDLSSFGGVTWGANHNIWRDTLWYGTPLPDFVLPANNGAVNSAPALDAPGMGETYYVDGKPDHGSTQAGGGVTPPIPPTPSGDTTPPTVRITAPSPGALISGTAVTVSAEASDNRGVTSVVFLLDGQQVGGDNCCVSVDVIADSTQVPNGPHTLSARATDAAGNQGTAAAVPIIVFNGTTPVPPTPQPGVHPNMACTGDIGAQGRINMLCTPHVPQR